MMTPSHVFSHSRLADVSELVVTAILIIFLATAQLVPEINFQALEHFYPES